MTDSQGTYECSYCGVATPHNHDVDAVNKERVMRYAFENACVRAFDYLSSLRPQSPTAWGVHSSDPFNVNCRGNAWNHRNPVGHAFDYWDAKIEDLWKFFKIAWEERDKS